MNKKTIGYMVVGAVIIGSISFYTGLVKGSKNIASTDQSTFNGVPNRNGNRGMRGGNGFNGGKVIAKDLTSLTIQARDGSSKIVFFTQATPVSKMVAGTQGDIIIGGDVNVIGTPNPDGSISAESISLRPAMLPSTQKN